jgi:sigma-B regulation protein RsbU (phosphoserine phosphatase)
MTTKQAVKRVSVPSATVEKQPFDALAGPDKTVDTIPAKKKGVEDLSKLVVEEAAVLAHGASVHLWKLIGGEPTSWEKTGRPPRADKPTVEASVSRRGVEGSSSQWSSTLKTNGEVFGVLEVFGTTSLSEEVRDSLEQFATIAESALNHVNQLQALQELSAILEATKLLNSTLDLSGLIKIVLQLATRLSGADRGTVFLLDKERNEIWSLVGLGLEVHEIRVSVGRGIAGWVARHGQPVRLEDAYADLRFDPTVDCVLGYRTHSLLALPVRNGSNEIVGVLELLNKTVGPFSISDQEFLSHLSDHVALALDKAQLHRELLARQRIESDLVLARSVQQGLLPEHPPDLEGFDISVAYTPSEFVGGDYYDFVPLNPQEMLTVIADAEGKGVASALMMASVRAALHTLAGKAENLENIIESMNEMLLSDSRTVKLLTIFLGVLDHRRRRFSFINAGHVPPIVIRRDGTVVELAEGGMVIGVTTSAPYERGYLQFEQGDILIGYTDGITEAMDINGTQYAKERLVDMVLRERDTPAKQIVETVLADVDRFSQAGLHSDDRVVLILKVL